MTSLLIAWHMQNGSIHGIAKPCICSSINVPSYPQHPLNIFKYPFLLNIIQYILISSRKILVPRCESICTPVIPSAQCLRLPAASPPQIGEKTQQKRFGARWSLSLVTHRSPGGFQLIAATWPPVTVLSLEWMRSASAKYNSETGCNELNSCIYMFPECLFHHLDGDKSPLDPRSMNHENKPASPTAFWPQLAAARMNQPTLVQFRRHPSRCDDSKPDKWRNGIQCTRDSDATKRVSQSERHPQDEDDDNQRVQVNFYGILGVQILRQPQQH
jgi:hypothetical protein